MRSPHNEPGSELRSEFLSFYKRVRSIMVEVTELEKKALLTNQEEAYLEYLNKELSSIIRPVMYLYDMIKYNGQPPNYHPYYYEKELPGIKAFHHEHNKMVHKDRAPLDALLDFLQEHKN